MEGLWHKACLKSGAKADSHGPQHEIAQSQQPTPRWRQYSTELPLWCNEESVATGLETLGPGIIYLLCSVRREKHSWEIKCSLFDRKRIQHFPLHVGTMLHKISLMWGSLSACTRSISPNSPSPRNHLLRLHFSRDWAPFYNIFNGALSVDKHIWGIGSVSVRFLPEGRENNALFLAKNKR